MNLVAYMLARQGQAATPSGLPQAVLEADGWVAVGQSPDILKAPRQHASLWLQARLTNGSDAFLSRWLEVSPWRLNTVEVWLLDEASDTVQAHLRSGLDVPPRARAIDSHRVLVPVSLQPGQSLRMLMHVHSDSRPFLSIRSWTPVAFTAANGQRYLHHSILLAVVLTLVAVLLLQMNLRYLLVGLWMVTMFVFEAEKEGYISFLLFEGFAEHAAKLRFTSSLLAKALFMSVSVYLLGLQRHAVWRWVLPVTLGLSALYGGLTFVLDGVVLRNLASVFHLACALLWPMMVPDALRMPHSRQRELLGLLVLAWGTSTLFVLSYIFNIRYTAEFAVLRIAVEAGVVLGLLLVYARQKRDHEHSLELQLRDRERQERARFEHAVVERTRELNEALERARKADAAKTDFLGRVTHDLKSPLTAIMGYAQLLRAEQGQVGKMSGIIHGSASHMLNLVTRLIEYARGATGEAMPGDVCLPTFIDTLGHEALILAARQGNRFRLEMPPTAYPMIHCDQTFLREILLNLLENATRYTRNGDISLHVACTRATAGGLKLECTVQDSGCGVAEAEQVRLFDPFYRASAAGEGVGLGLAIVKELAERMGGRVELSSTPGHGTRVTVVLPVEPGRNVQAATGPEPSGGGLWYYPNALAHAAWGVEGLPVTHVSQDGTPDNPQPFAWPALDDDALRPLRHWLALGAVTDIVEWCDALKSSAPECAAFADHLRQLAERGDFHALGKYLNLS